MSIEKNQDADWTKNIFIKGLTGVIFRITQAPIAILNSLYLSWTTPDHLAAAGLITTTQSFIVHAPGAVFNALSMKFDANDPANSANTYYAAVIIAATQTIIILPVMLLSRDILVKIFNQNLLLSDNVQSHYQAFATGYFAVQLFSINRQFINSACGDNTSLKYFKYLISPIVGSVELIIFSTLGYGLICGKLGLPYLTNAGSGYAISVANWFGALGTLALLMIPRELRQYIWQKPEWGKIRSGIGSILSSGLPISLRFIMENMGLVGFSFLAGKISQNNLSALQIAWSSLQFQTEPCFSFIHATKQPIKDSPNKRKAANIVMSTSTGYAALWVLPISFFAKPITRFFLTKETEQNKTAIENINQITLPLLAASEIANAAFHTERAVLQGAEEIHNKKIHELAHNARKPIYENWIVAGHSFVFQFGLLLPLAYFFGKVMDWELPGMSGVYLTCMLAIALTLAPRYSYYINNPSKKPSGCWGRFFKNNSQENMTELTPINALSPEPL